MNPVDHYTARDLERWCGPQELRKAHDYVDAVSALETSPARIEALVQGRAPEPYAVGVELIPDGKHTRMASQCTCPVGGDCKHVAAVLLRVLEQREQADHIDPAVLRWAEDLRRSALRPGLEAKPRTPNKLFYVLEWNPVQRAYGIALLRGRAESDGAPSPAAEEWHNLERALVQPPQFIDQDDLAILRLLWTQLPRDSISFPLQLDARHGDDLMRRMIATGRLYANRHAPKKIRAGETRPAKLAWGLDAYGRSEPHVDVSPPAPHVLPLEPLWYVDPQAGEAGPLALEGPSPVVRKVLSLPPLNRNEAPVVAQALQDVAPALPSPLDADAAALRVIDTAPAPLLTLDTRLIHGMGRYRDYRNRYQPLDFDYAVPRFRYAEVDVGADDRREFITLASGETVRVRRRYDQEARWLKSLPQYGLTRVPPNTLYAFGSVPAPAYGLASDAAWPDFVASAVPLMRQSGWKVDYAPTFRHHVAGVDAWLAEVEQSEPGWFTLAMGILVEGARLPLAPMLAELFQREGRWLDAHLLAQIRDDEAILLAAPDGKRIRVEAQRLKPLATTLIDLFDRDTAAPLRLPLFDAPRLAALADQSRWEFHGAESVLDLAQRLRDSRGVQPIAAPAGFALKLREYQQAGLAWLQYLREYNLSGILADDMGLGKTAQALAHLLLEKEAGRLDRPALVVLPTSLVFNWKAESARFAPGLSVLSLHGPQRKQKFDRIADHDVVLTTYPLLWRDHAALAGHEYHLLLLDEAQTVKNAQSRGAAVVRKLSARHRLCLTGTPLENHLGELWAQFDFLMPGFLGDAKTFARVWRTPIEKGGDRLRAELLRKRLQPFILRRTKEAVARELPPKTTIVRVVELEGGQRDLYETVRSAMDEKVRREIAGKGFKRSQIVILDALLKLRQVCCDPRLVKSSAAQGVHERAKLALLMDMLPELVSEGRRVLLFSQFTAMLALIEEELYRAALPYALLTGDTVDREGAIRTFQTGEVPIFLVSLKAGGVGLNLTAADTVIHYDPWWNPAVENQATDRAHRIGQDKPVFVYKLIVAGSIEERIVALQEKKAALAAGILSEDHGVDVKFSESDLEALLAPLPA